MEETEREDRRRKEERRMYRNQISKDESASIG